MPCIFCKIAKKEIKTDIVYDDKKNLAFKDIEPKAPIHLLIIPKKHILVDQVEQHNKELVGELFLVAKKLAKKKGVSETGYRLIINVGRDAGQTIEHLHLHLLGGEKLPWA